MTENERSQLDCWMNFDLWKPKASHDVCQQKPKILDKTENWCLQLRCQKFKEP